MNISDEAVEAGKLGLLRYYGCTELPTDVEDDDLHEGGKLVAEILAAAAPHLKAQAIDKACDDADGLGMGEILVPALRFRAECYRNIGANLYGSQS
jgi:hypothetical protein